MKVIKPLDLGFLHKVFEWDGRHQWVVTLLLGFPLRGGDVRLEQDIWRDIAAVLGKDAMLDMCMPKPQGEFLVAGKYFSPGGAKVQADRVRVRVGKQEKELAVFGDRYWQTGVPSEPEPMREMPLTWEKAFGGEGFKDNPAGRGMEKVDVFGEMRLPLPNVEYPRALMTSSGQRPEPACFLPRDIMAPVRHARMGTYDEAWIRNEAPNLAHDLDWRFFNGAPEDQWFSDFLAGTEDYEILNMHPDVPRITGKLPGLRPRIFIRQRDLHDEKGRFREIETRLDTLWLLPETDTGIMIYRGTATVAEYDATDVLHVVAGYERMADAPRSAEHYRLALDNRLDPEISLRYLTNTRDLIPEGFPCGFARLVAAGEDVVNHMRANQEARADALREEGERKLDAAEQQVREQLEKAGVDPAPHLEAFAKAREGAPDERTAKLMEIVEQIAPGAISNNGKVDISRLDLTKFKDFEAEMKAMGDAGKADARRRLEEAIVTLETQAKSFEGEALAAVNARIEEIRSALENMDQAPELPRPPQGAQLDQLRQQLDDLEKTRHELRARGIAEDRLPPKPDVDMDAMRTMLEESAGKFLVTYRMGAHLMDYGRPVHGMTAQAAGLALLGKSSHGGDYAGAMLAGADLAGRDLADVYLEDADLSNANLEGANLAGAVLARANISGANFSGANLEGANLGACRAQGARFEHAHMQGCVLGRSDLEKAILRAADLRKADFLEAMLAGADFSNAEFENPVFKDLVLDRVNFSGVRMKDAVFLMVQGEGANFDNATLPGATFVEVNLSGASFKGATLDNIRFVAASSLEGARFTNSNASTANFRDAKLAHADFSNATLEMSDFGGAELVHAKFTGANLYRGGFMHSNLEKADFSHANLMEANLLMARIVATDFSGANMFSVEFTNVTAGSTRFSGANLDRTLFRDWRPG